MLNRPSFILYLPILLLPTFLVRFKIGSLAVNILDLALLVVILFQLPSLWTYLKRAYTTPLVVISSLILLTALAATLIAPDHSLAFGAFKSWFLLPILYAWTLAAAGPLSLQLISEAWLLNLGLASVYGLGLMLSTHATRLTSWYDSPNFFAMASVPVLLLTTPVLWRKQPKQFWSRLTFFRVLWLLTALAFLLTISLGGYLSAVIGTAVFFIIRLRQRVPLYTIMTVVVLCLISIPFVSPGHLTPSSFGDRSESAKGRNQIWAASRILLNEHPILGIGLRQFDRYYQGTILRVTQLPVEKSVPEPHNLFLALWLNLGLLGVGLFLWLYGLLILKLPTHPTWEVAALIAAAIAIIAHGIVDSPYFNNDLAVLFWIVWTLVLPILKAQKARE